MNSGSSTFQLPPPGSTSSSNSSRRHRTTTSSGTTSRRQCCFSFAAYARALMDHLRRCGVRVEAGLSEMELRRVESQLTFTFPPDLRAILQEGLPTGSSFPNWRSTPASDLRVRMQQPLSEICTEVRKNKFWFDKWGSRPLSHEQAAKMAAEKLKTVPVLVPVYGNCFIPATESAGNPVLLVQSGDVSVLGNDVADFFEKEVFHSSSVEDRLVDNGEDDEDGAVQSSCLMGSLKTGGEKDKWTSSSTTSSWGRRSLNPEALFVALRKKKIFSRGTRDVAGSRSAEASPRPSVSSTHSSNSGLIHADPPRRSLDVLPRRKSTSSSGNKSSKGVALEALLGFTMAAPAWAAKRPKKIDFWTDLSLQDDLLPAPVPSPSSAKSRDVGPELKAKVESESRPPTSQVTVHNSSSVSATIALSTSKVVALRGDEQKQPDDSQGWLDGYLDDMAGRLRTGGWKEADICEMMVSTESLGASSVSLKNAIVPRQSRQAVIQGLVSKVQELSHSLQKSGWSVQDVGEALNASNLSLWASSQQVFSFATAAGYIAVR